MPKLYLLDIEGTTSPISFVYDVLFPYARERMRDYLLRHAHDSALQADLRLLAQENAIDRASGAPIIYFGTDSSTLLPAMNETGAEVIGLDWRIPLDKGWSDLEHRCAVQGNLDPVLLFADWKELKSRAENILQLAAGRPGHIFNLGHGILPETPVDNVKNLARLVQEYSASNSSSGSRKPAAGSRVP